MNSYLLILHLTILSTVLTEDIFDPVDSIAIFQKIEKQTHVIGRYHTFLHKLDLHPLYEAFHKINLLIDQNNLRNTSQRISESLIHEEENFKIILYQEFKKFRPIKRNKRGLFNIIGDIDKQLFGVATEKHIEQFESKLNTLLNNEKKIAAEVNLRTSLLKIFTNKTIKLIHQIDKNNKKLEYNIKYFADSLSINLQTNNY